jgi:transposase
MKKKVSTGSMKILSNKIMYIRVDVHKESWYIKARTDGEEVFNGRIPATYHCLIKLLERFKDCQVKVAYEAGPCGFSLHDKLMEDGIDTIVVPPSLIPIESDNRVKTDKRDSRELARFLESNILKKVFIHREEERLYRELIRTRRQLLEHRGCVARQIKNKLLFYNISSPFPIRYGWGRPYIQWLKNLPRQSTYLRGSLDIFAQNVDPDIFFKYLDRFAKKSLTLRATKL